MDLDSLLIHSAIGVLAVQFFDCDRGLTPLETILKLTGHLEVVRGRPGPEGGLVRPASRARSTPSSARTARGSRRSSRSSPGPTRPTRGRSSRRAARSKGTTRSRPRALGIAAIYQQPALFPDLTVAENIALGLEPPGGWRVDPLASDGGTGPASSSIGSARAIDPEAEVRRLDDARAAARRDRPGPRGRGEDPDHGRALGLA